MSSFPLIPAEKPGFSGLFGIFTRVFGKTADIRVPESNDQIAVSYSFLKNNP